MNRYRIRISVDGKRKLYYIEDQENYDIVLLPSKYLKHKADANRSPNTVRRLALSICYYLNYLDQTGTELLQVAKKSFEEQSSHFGQFLYWLVEGRHITDNRTAKTGNGTCNAYLKDVFGFFLYLAEYRRLLQRQSLLFINIRGETAGKPMRVESVYDMLDRMEEKTGIKLTPHMLRRYYAVSRRDTGWALELIQLALGHKHLDTTVKYLGILDNQLMTASREFYEKHSDLYGIKDLL